MLTGQSSLGDRALQALARLFPNHLPVRLLDYRDRFEHHLILKTGGQGIPETQEYLAAAVCQIPLEYFECTDLEAEAAFLQRFAVAGAAVRYRALHPDEVEDIVALDIALRRNDCDWFETLPAQMAKTTTHTLYYGHFFCHVFHQDYIVLKGTDLPAFKLQMERMLDARGADDCGL